jgi:hypothetical protein
MNTRCSKIAAVVIFNIYYLNIYINHYSCEHGNEPPGSITGTKFLYKLSNYQLLKMLCVKLVSQVF